MGKRTASECNAKQQNPDRPGHFGNTHGDPGHSDSNSVANPILPAAMDMATVDSSVCAGLGESGAPQCLYDETHFTPTRFDTHMLL